MMAAMPPFGGGALGGGGLFGGGMDPFNEFSAMPFSGGGGGSIMSRFDQMANEMMQGFGPVPGSGREGGAGGSLPGGGSYASQSFAFSSVTGPDGKVHTERFTSSDVGNRDQKIREAQQAYSNSSTGIDKMGLERHLGDRARKIVKERDRNTREERSSEMMRGMDESSRDAFDREFGGKAQHLPAHGRFDPRMLSGGSGGSGRNMIQAPIKSMMGNGGARGNSMPGSGRRR